MDPAARMSMGGADKTPDGPSRPATKEGASATVRRLRVADLFTGDRELILEHGGQDYRLRITANGKLILTK